MPTLKRTSLLTRSIIQRVNLQLKNLKPHANLLAYYTADELSIANFRFICSHRKPVAHRAQMNLRLIWNGFGNLISITDPTDQVTRSTRSRIRRNTSNISTLIIPCPWYVTLIVMPDMCFSTDIDSCALAICNVYQTLNCADYHFTGYTRDTDIIMTGMSCLPWWWQCVSGC